MANSYEILLKIGGALDGSLTKAISGVTKSLQGIDKTTEKSSKSLGSIGGVTEKASSGLKSLAKAAVGLAAGFSVAEGFKSVMEAASQTETVTKQLQTVLKSTGGVAGVTQQAAEGLASSLSSVTDFSKNAVLGSENLLLTFTKIGKDIMPDATETVLNMSQALGQDTKSSAIQLGKALNDPVKGITALTRVGVSFTQQQKDQIKAMEKAGNVAGAQKIILKELGTEFGGSAKAAAQTFSGQMTIAKNAVFDASAQIGESLVPMIQNILPKLALGVKGFANFMTDHKQDIADVTTVVGGFISKIVDGAMPVIGSLGKALGSLNDNVIQPFIAGLEGGVWEDNAFTVFFNTIGGNIRDMGRSISGLMPTITEGFGDMGSAIEGIAPYVKDIFGTLANISGDALGNVFDGLKAAMPSVVGYVKNLQSAWKGILPIVESVALFISTKVLPVFNQIVTFVLTKVVPALLGAFQTWLPKVVKIFQDLWAGIQPILTVLVNVFKVEFPVIQAYVMAAIKGISDVIGGLLDILDGVINFVTGVFTGNWGKAWGGVKEIFSGIFESLVGIVKVPINAIIGLVNNVIDSIDSLSIKIPDGVPGIGGKTIGGFNIPHIPQLAEGGIISHKTGGILANIGEGSYDEAVVPLKKSGGLLANIGSALPNIPHMPNVPAAPNISSVLPSITQMVNSSSVSNVSNISNTTNNGAQNKSGGLMSYVAQKPPIQKAKSGDTMQIIYSPTFPITGSTAPEIQQAVKQAEAMSQSEFARFMKQWKADQLRTGFAQ